MTRTVEVTLFRYVGMAVIAHISQLMRNDLVSRKVGSAYSTILQLKSYGTQVYPNTNI